MAVSGTITGVFNTQGAWAITITGLTSGSTSPVFTLKEYPNSSFVIKGTIGAGATLQWQGSNDGGTTWANVGTSITTATYPTVNSGTLSPGSMFYGLYQLVITGGDGTTSLGVNIRAVMPR